MDGLIDELRVEEIQGIPECTPAAMGGWADRYLATFNGLAKGVVPESIPSIEQIAAPCRIILFELAFESLVDGAALSVAAKQSLTAGKADLREPFATGDTLGVLKVSARLLAGPLMDHAIDRVREGLVDGDRFAIIRRRPGFDEMTALQSLPDWLDESRPAKRGAA